MATTPHAQARPKSRWTFLTLIFVIVALLPVALTVTGLVTAQP
jgi:hypothetical protein